MIRMSLARTVRVAVKLLPSLLALRRDRRQWIRQEGRNVETERYRRNARRALETFIALGPVYIKLGQWLSSRADILPQPYMEELAKLQDDVPPAPFESVRPVIEAELGGTISEKFDSMEREAFSGASLGQVYRAESGGRRLVVKVKRPGIDGQVEEDLAVLKRVLPLAMRFVDPNLQFSARAMLSQFVETIREEMDYTVELENLRRIRDNMRPYPDVIVPDAYPELSSGSVLTMEYVPGVKVTDIAELDRLGVDRRKLVTDIHRIFFTMLLRHAVFHADPHPGNLSVAPDGRLILYDYGMVGRLDGETRMQLVRLYLALVDKDPSRTVDAMSALGMLTPDFNRTVIERAIELTVRAMHGRRPEEMEVRSLMEIANKTMSRFPFILPKHLALYMRMGSIIEGIYRTHDVDFKFVRVLRDILVEENLLRDAYAEEAKLYLGRIAKSIDAVVGLAPDLRRMVDDARSDRLRGRGGGGGGGGGGPPALLPGAVMAGSVFVGSSILHGTGAVGGDIAAAGMACSLAAMGVLVALGLRRR